MPQGLANGDMGGKSLAVIGGNHLGIGLYGATIVLCRFAPIDKPVFQSSEQLFSSTMAGREPMLTRSLFCHHASSLPCCFLRFV